jgi:hypothetical protein
VFYLFDEIEEDWHVVESIQIGLNQLTELYLNDRRGLSRARLAIRVNLRVLWLNVNQLGSELDMSLFDCPTKMVDLRLQFSNDTD